MIDKPTTLDELLSYDFLSQRLSAIREQIATKPNKTALWIGAGYSTNLAGLPTWRSFLLNCLNHLPKNNRESKVIKSIIEAGRLQLAAEYIHQLLGNQLFDLIKTTFANASIFKKPTISRYCSTKIITTNYDVILENAMKWYEIRTPVDTIESLLNPAFSLIKLHGSANNPSSCVLSVSSYARAYNRDFEWYLINTFLVNTVVFIGASMDRSEPFFNYLATIRRYKMDHPMHYAIVAVESNDHAKQLGRELSQFGISLIPFIPDNNYTIFNELLTSFAPSKWSHIHLNSRLKLIRDLIQDRHYLDVAVFLHHMCQDELTRHSDKRSFGDVINRFLSTLLLERKPDEIISKCKRAELNIASIVIAAGELLDVTSSAFDGVIRGLIKLQEIEKENYQIPISLLLRKKAPNSNKL